MRLLLDAHLPPALAKVLTKKGYDATTVTALSMKSCEDSTIWNYAKENGFTLVSKDEDFIRLLGDKGSSPALIWIRTGNCKNRELIEAVVKTMPDAISFIENGHTLVEVYRESD